MKRTGNLLKTKREALGISLQEVSAQLKISSRILRALEEGDSSRLPAKTFLRGFVQSYAQYLRADGDEVLKVFQDEMGSTHPSMITKQTELNIDENENSGLIQAKEDSVETNKIDVYAQKSTPGLSVDHKTWSNSMKIITVLTIISIGAIIYGVIRTIQKYEKEATVVSEPNIENQLFPRTEKEPLTSPIARIENQNNQNEAIEKSILPNPIKEPENPIALRTEIPKEGNRVETQELESTPKVSPTPELTAMPTSIEERKVQEIIIEALDRVVIDYSIDGKAKATLVLGPEKVHTFRGEKAVILGFSDGGAINLIYNGKDKGVPGNLGKPLSISFPEKQ